MEKKGIVVWELLCHPLSVVVLRNLCIALKDVVKNPSLEGRISADVVGVLSMFQMSYPSFYGLLDTGH